MVNWYPCKTIIQKNHSYLFNYILAKKSNKRKVIKKCFFLVFSSIRIKDSSSPHPLRFFCFDFFTIYILLVKIRTIFILQLTGEAREFLGLSHSSPKKGEERSILILTPSPKTSTLNLQLIEEDVIITN
jgi:hypothetical protein